MMNDGATPMNRRQLVRGMMAGGVALGLGWTPAAGDAATPARPRPATPDEALARLMAGNRRFANGQAEGLRRSMQRIRETAEGQTPFAAILGCADSRVPPELVFDQGVGDLFVVRVAGNVATPEEIGSLEFGVAVLGAQVLLVLGHSQCGAVKAAVAGTPAPGQITTLYQHMHHAVHEAAGDVGRAVELNALHQRDILRSRSTVLRDAIDAGTLRIEAGVYDLATGAVHVLEARDA